MWATTIGAAAVVSVGLLAVPPAQAGQSRTGWVQVRSVQAVEPVVLDVPGTGAAAHRISEAGVVVGTTYDEAGRSHAFRWQAGQATVLDGLAEDSDAVDVNEHGQVLVRTFRDDGTTGAVLWEADGSVVDVAPSSGSTYAWDIDDQGRVAVELVDPWTEMSQAALWQAGELTPLPDNGAGSYVGQSGALNERGEVVGTIEAADGSGPRAVVWRGGQPTPLAVPSGVVASTADAVNERGDVLGSVRSSTGSRAVVWEKGRARYLVAETAPQQTFTDLNTYGVAVGSIGDQHAPGRATVAYRTGAQALPGLGGTAGSAYGVNDWGVVVGATAPDAESPYRLPVAWVRGAAVPLSGVVGGKNPVNGAALDVDERGRAVGYVQFRDEAGNVGLDMKALLWQAARRS